LLQLMVWFLVFSTSGDPSPAGPAVPLEVDGDGLHHDRMCFVVLPGGQVSLSTPDTAAVWRFSTGDPLDASGAEVDWTAPRSHGVYTVTLSAGGISQVYSIIIPVESSRWRTATLNSFPIGYYGGGNDRDANPSWFIELTSGSMGVRISTHFTLGEFLGHVEGQFPQYMALDLALVDKLEAVIDELETLYPEALDVNVMSGFRTPVYNSAIGNDTDMSLHLYGKAADVWIESFPPNNLMDDIDRNKRVDVGDGQYLVDATRRVEACGGVCVGGASAYRWTPQHGPFTHIDVRGRPACWQTQLNLVPDPVI
jgi:hypothetical protein